MKFGMIGLGRMGANMVLNAMDHKHKVVVHNRSHDPIRALAKKGAVPAFDIGEFMQSLGRRKVVWMMITAGRPVDDLIDRVLPFLNEGDILIDGGNSYFLDSIRRAKKVSRAGVEYLDCGVSGGVSGARHGACMMIGGSVSAFKRVSPLLKSMCVKDGFGHMGKSGAGHYVKMVHNAIEYGMIGAIAEGMCALKDKQRRFGFDLGTVSKVYANGSIVESRLMSWFKDAWDKDPGLTSIAGEVPFGGTEDEMIKLEKFERMPILRQARLMRKDSRSHPSFCGKVIAAIRHEFGGHKVKRK